MNPSQDNSQSSPNDMPTVNVPQFGASASSGSPANSSAQTSFQAPSFLTPEKKPEVSQASAPITDFVQSQAPQVVGLTQDPSITSTPTNSNNLGQSNAGLDALPSVTPSPPKAKTFLSKKTIIIATAVAGVLLVGLILSVLLLKKNKKTAEPVKGSNSSTVTNYSNMKPTDMFNNLIAEFGKESGVVAGPLHKGVDNGGETFQNMTTAYDSADDQFLWIASTHGGVDFSTTDESTSEPCKQRLEKISKYRNKLVNALGQAGYKAIKTRFDDAKDSQGEAICIENTAYYNEFSKNYCSEGRTAKKKSLTVDIACTDQKRGDGRITLSKEIVPLLKSAKANQESYIVFGAPQKSATDGYETLIVFHKATTQGVFADIGAYRKTGQPWKLLPDNSGFIQGFDCSILSKDPDIAKAYAGKECYTGNNKRTI